MEKRYGVRSPEFLASRGMLGPHVLAVHLTEGAATLHVPAAHSPISQRKLPTRNF